MFDSVWISFFCCCCVSIHRILHACTFSHGWLATIDREDLQYESYRNHLNSFVFHVDIINVRFVSLVSCLLFAVFFFFIFYSVFGLDMREHTFFMFRQTKPYIICMDSIPMYHLLVALHPKWHTEQTKNQSIARTHISIIYHLSFWVIKEAVVVLGMIFFSLNAWLQVDTNFILAVRTDLSSARKGYSGEFFPNSFSHDL